MINIKSAVGIMILPILYHNRKQEKVLFRKIFPLLFLQAVILTVQQTIFQVLWNHCQMLH